MQEARGLALKVKPGFAFYQVAEARVAEWRGGTASQIPGSSRNAVPVFVEDLKSCGDFSSCGFDSHRGTSFFFLLNKLRVRPRPLAIQPACSPSFSGGPAFITCETAFLFLIVFLVVARVRVSLI